MIDAIDLRREELGALCRRCHVQRLDLFGSAARGDFDPEHSDIDFLVEFDREHPEALSFNTYFGLKEALEALLGRPVDLVEGRAQCAIPTSRRASVARGSRSLKRDPESSAEERAIELDITSLVPSVSRRTSRFVMG
jgi:predicted nucleotidyltransferase